MLIPNTVLCLFIACKIYLYNYLLYAIFEQAIDILILAKYVQLTIIYAYNIVSFMLFTV